MKKRDQYLEEIKSNMWNGAVKAITGSRHCGKSHVLRETNRRKSAKWLLATLLITGAVFCAVGEDEKLPAAKWDFESNDGLAMKGCAICSTPGHGKCLALLSPASRATVKTAAKLPEIASQKSPYTLAIWLRPDKSVISDTDVEMAKLGGRRMTKFLSAMHDGKWHHLAVTYDPARTNKEYAVYLDWSNGKSTWRFMSFYAKNAGMSKCILPFSLGSGKAVFGGKVGMSLFSVGYSGMIDDVTIYNRALTDDEVRYLFPVAFP